MFGEVRADVMSPAHITTQKKRPRFDSRPLYPHRLGSHVIAGGNQSAEWERLSGEWTEGRRTNPVADIDSIKRCANGCDAMPIVMRQEVTRRSPAATERDVAGVEVESPLGRGLCEGGSISPALIR